PATCTCAGPAPPVPGPPARTAPPSPPRYAWTPAPTTTWCWRSPTGRCRRRTRPTCSGAAPRSPGPTASPTCRTSSDAATPGTPSPCCAATLRAVRADLVQDHYLYRFRHDRRPLEEAEGAFLLCGFVLALAEHQQGDAVEAVRWFERNRAACGPAGLYAEEFDVAQRQLRGNLPQAFVHALLLEASVRLAQPA
ncbi:glycoside hydrolase family 15 protein, partial [Kitasatospora sp. NPDC007106]|uniref:glycoside hydrolase family 15 protein n=1 Tax=Kitasatospora sp. NPDC007106 TaxID=3156914 RepID=UPI0033EBC6B6